jgi:pimeloyl-ACP methyl ester carboxylesterase
MHTRSGDADIFYTTLGDGPDIVLLHAFPANHEMWLPVANALSTKYRVTLIDLRGHGLSSAGEGPATMQKHVADVRCVCKDAGVNRAVFGGVSIGGYILFEFWRTFRDQVRALMLADTRSSADSPDARAARLQSAKEVLDRGTTQFIDSMLPKLLGETTRNNRSDLVDAARKMMSRASSAGISAALQGMAARPDSTATLRTITVPTLVLAGDEDTATPIADAQLIHQNIKESQLKVIPRAGHYAVFENPEDTLRALRPFLDNLR